MTFFDSFKGDNSALLESTKALIELDAAGSLVPHGLGGHARVLLNALASRLATRDGAVERLEEALTPSEATKAAYSAEFDFRLFRIDECGDEYVELVMVPWDTIKEIMAAIRARALLADAEGEGK